MSPKHPVSDCAVKFYLACNVDSFELSKQKPIIKVDRPGHVRKLGSGMRGSKETPYRTESGTVVHVRDEGAKLTIGLLGGQVIAHDCLCFVTEVSDCELINRVYDEMSLRRARTYLEAQAAHFFRTHEDRDDM
jgi:hypothetical protein